MRKHLVAMAMFISLLATAAGASAFTFDVAGNVDPGLRARVTVDYSSWSSPGPFDPFNPSIPGLPEGGTATFTIQNMSATPGVITGFAFGMPQDGLGVFSAGAGFSTHPSFQLFNYGAVLPNSINVPQFSGNFDMGMGTGPNFAGGNPGGGILLGQTATFSLLFNGPGAAGLTLSSILAALAQEPGPHFAVRFQATGLNGEGSDVATPTPIPGAVWLLGSGLLGIMGFKRRRTA